MFKKLNVNRSGSLDVHELARLASAVVPFDPTAAQLLFFRCES